MDVYDKLEGKWNRSDRLFHGLGLEQPVRQESPYVIALTGAGGKTSLIRRLAWEGVNRGLKVLVTTTTHMARPARLGVFSWDGPGWNEQAVRAMLDREHAAVVGRITGEGKIAGPGASCYKAVCAMADLVLVEADGSRRLPLKVPGPGEPVIPENTDMILSVAGLTASGMAAEDHCFRLEYAMQIMEAHGRPGFMKDGQWTIYPEDMGCLLRYGYMEPLGILYPGIPVIPVLNQADTGELAGLAFGILDGMGETRGIVTGGLLGEPSAEMF